MRENDGYTPNQTGGFCGQRRLLVMKPNLQKANGIKMEGNGRRDRGFEIG
jgi:hypothetical protein